MASYDLCTLDECREYMDMKGTDSLVNDLLADLITRVSDRFHQYVGITQFKSQSYTEYYSGQGNQELFLDKRPIISVTTIKEDSEWAFGNDSTKSSDDYAILDDRVVLKDDSFGAGIRNIQVIYTAGYATIPGDLRQACIEEVSRAFDKRQNVDISSRTLPDTTTFTARNDSLMPDTIDVLKRYIGVGVY